LRYLFENYALDTDRREVRRGAKLVAIPPQVFDLLDYLIRNREHVVSKDDLIDAIWKGRIVSEAALTTRLNAARTAIGDTGREQRLIKTLPRKGVRFVGIVREAEGPAAATAADNPQEPPKPAFTLPDKPSIAVLPFANLSSDPEQEYFVDGIAEDIIAGLSRSKSVFVIARTSSFTYKGRAVDLKQVGRELGVRYVLEGSIRKSGNRVRITGQLVDAATGSDIWTDRYDCTLEDIFDLQDQVTMSVVGALTPQLERAEMARVQCKPTESLQAYDFYLRALATFYCFTQDGNIEAFKLAEMASRLDPNFARPCALAADCLVQRWAFGWSTGSAEDVEEARRLAQRALEIDKDDPTALALAGMALALFVGKVEDGAALLTRAITFDPNLALARIWNGWAQLGLGNQAAAIEQFQIGLRLSPFDPRIFVAQTGMTAAHFLAGKYEEGCAWSKIAVQQNPNFVGAHRNLVACHAMAGRIEEARQAWAVARQIYPTQRISTNVLNRLLRQRPQDVQRYTEAFRMVGMPE
jgi:TolB-like protein/Flp pilus assembly protein TadD